ncbi:hypothetical protein [Sinorhizobium meliloti]|uniref:hypothetical protein n=1 Tax=Rhizobium meliloti TaxID=382 RepID=UPI00209193CB|nr:hypothetical protein [Sinorhizobium meliloti]MCO5966014.1 hypothetical protein [Sinorhizobium meliloti]
MADRARAAVPYEALRTHTQVAWQVAEYHLTLVRIPLWRYARFDIEDLQSVEAIKRFLASEMLNSTVLFDSGAANIKISILRVAVDAHKEDDVPRGSLSRTRRV